MATMYSLFLGVFLAAVCSTEGVTNTILTSSTPSRWKRSGIEGSMAITRRDRIIAIASAELGVREATGKNDGPRVEEYLRYTHLGSGYEWCASFVSWVYGQAGYDQPRNPWSPALFPKARTYWKAGAFVRGDKSKVEPADVFGIYGATAKRINHVGLVKVIQGNYLISIEGNSNNRVESRRRHIRTIYAFADWLK